MKVYVIFDPLYERVVAVYKNEKEAWDECERRNNFERQDSSYHYEAQDFEVIE